MCVTQVVNSRMLADRLEAELRAALGVLCRQDSLLKNGLPESSVPDPIGTEFPEEDTLCWWSGRAEKHSSIRIDRNGSTTAFGLWRANAHDTIGIFLPGLVDPERYRAGVKRYVAPFERGRLTPSRSGHR